MTTSHSLISAADHRLLEKFWSQPAIRSILPNGLTLIVRPSAAAPVASIQVIVKTGSIHEEALLGGGASHFLEHMLFNGTTHREGRAISAELQACGGEVNAYTTFDHTAYYVDLPADRIGKGIEVLGDIVLNSTLPEAGFAKERDVILREIAMVNDNTSYRFHRIQAESAFRVNPYRHPIIGYKDVFSTLTRDDLLSYYRKRYTPDNIVVVVAGDVHPRKILDQVNTVFGESPRGRASPVFPASEPRQIGARSLHHYEQIAITHGALSWHIPGLLHEDAAALEILAGILSDGASSLLWRNLREREQLVFEIGATNWNPPGGGLFSVSFACAPEKRVAAENAIRRELDQLAEGGPSLETLRKVAHQQVASRINSAKTTAGWASLLGEMEVNTGGIDFDLPYFERLGRVRPTDIQAVIQNYFSPHAQTTVSLNPVSAASKSHKVKRRRSVSGLQKQLRLPNGAQILLLPNHEFPSVQIQALWRAGRHCEPDTEHGACALMAKLLTKDTAVRSAAELAEEIDGLGASFSASSGNNSVTLAMDVFPSDVARGLELFEEAILRASFLSETLEVERATQLAILKNTRDNVVRFARMRLRELYFERHPFGIEAIGDEEGVKRVTPASLRALHQKLCVAENSVLVLSGDFEAKEWLPKLEDFALKLRRGNLPMEPAAFRRSKPLDVAERRPCEQAVVLDAFPGPDLLSADDAAASVVNELLSGMSSQLFERVREEKGLAYFVSASRLVGTGTGMFCVFAGTAPGKEAQVRAEFDAELARLRAGRVAAEEIARCQTRLKAGLRMSLQTNEARAMRNGLRLLFGQPLEGLAEYDARIDAVTKADVQRFARNYLSNKSRARLVVSPS